LGAKEKLALDENRFFDPEPSVRKTARELYEEVKDLPIVSPHGHVDPTLFSENRPFTDPTELILIPDHYVFRMLYSRGISLESLGIPAIDGTVVEADHRKIWQIFGNHYYLFAGTPTGVWLNHELSVVFGVEDKLNGDSAMRIYDQIDEKLKSPEFLPRALFDRFNIEVLTTTDGASDDLEHHHKIRESGWNGNIIPCFRPDSAVKISDESWPSEVRKLSEAAGIEINSYKSFITALENRRAYFKQMGAVSTDHAVVEPYTREFSEKEAEEIFQQAVLGRATKSDARLFTALMLMEFARMSIEDGLVMQIHAGSFRNHNLVVFRRFGPDKGCDIPVQTEYTQNLQELLNKYGNDSRLKLILFTLDESTYSRELAPLAGHYPSLRLGPPWWFHDSIQGMTRFRQRVTETAGIYNTAGFNDDTRAFPSIPARHDLSRRMDANFLGRLVARHIIDLSDARRMIRDLAYNLVKDAYNL
jgi:glucuronate isomerase